MVIDTNRKGLRFRLFKGTLFAACGKVFRCFFAFLASLPVMDISSSADAVGVPGACTCNRARARIFAASRIDDSPHAPKTMAMKSGVDAKHEMTIAKRELMFSRLDFSISRFAT